MLYMHTSGTRGGKEASINVDANIVRCCQANQDSKGSQVSGCADVSTVRWHPSSNPLSRPVTADARTYYFDLEYIVWCLARL